MCKKKQQLQPLLRQVSGLAPLNGPPVLFSLSNTWACPLPPRPHPGNRERRIPAPAVYTPALCRLLKPLLAHPRCSALLDHWINNLQDKRAAPPPPSPQSGCLIALSISIGGGRGGACKGFHGISWLWLNQIHFEQLCLKCNV